MGYFGVVCLESRARAEGLGGVSEGEGCVELVSWSAGKFLGSGGC